MRTNETPDSKLKNFADRQLRAYGARGAQRKLGVHARTVERVANGEPVRPETLVKLRDAIRTEEEFKVQSTLTFPTPKKSSLSWPLENVRSARDAQLKGDFAKPAQLATAMLLDDAIFTAYFGRIAPVSSLGTYLEPGPQGKSVAEAADEAIHIPQEVLASIDGVMAMHGVAFGINDHEVSDDGTVVKFRHREWPIEFVKWDDTRQIYTTKDADGNEIDITHGDGRWVIYRKFERDAHKREACILPSALIFICHLDAIRSWAAASDSHGQAKMVGKLPEGVPMQDGSETTLSPEGSAFLDTLVSLASGTAGAGIVPFGAEVDFLANGSNAWQVFDTLANNREKAAARVWQGNDGVLGSQGGAPGVDIEALFGVALTKVEGDVTAIENALYSGVYAPWTAMHYGDSKKAPRLKFLIPDADAEKQRAEKREAREAMFADIKAYRESGFELTQETVDEIAADYGLTPPTLADVGATAPSVVLSPTDVAKVTLVREARAANGLPPLGDERDDMTIEELTAFTEAKRERDKVAAEAQANAAVNPAT